MDTGANGAADHGKHEANDFMLSVLEEAMGLIRAALGRGERNAAYWLARGHANNTKATAGALLSAWDTFVRHLDEDEEIPDSVTMEDLAAIYIRRAYNRLRRKLGQEKKMTAEVARANVRGTDGEFLPFDPADPKSRNELMKILPDEIAIDLSARPERDRLVIILWIESCTYEAIVEQVKSVLPEAPISIATVSRVIERFKDDMHRRLKDG